MQGTLYYKTYGRGRRSPSPSDGDPSVGGPPRRPPGPGGQLVKPPQAQQAFHLSPYYFDPKLKLDDIPPWHGDKGTLMDYVKQVIFVMIWPVPRPFLPETSHPTSIVWVLLSVFRVASCRSRMVNASQGI